MGGGCLDGFEEQEMETDGSGEGVISKHTAGFLGSMSDAS